MLKAKDNVGKNICAVIVYQLVALCFGMFIPHLLLTQYGATMHGLTSTISNLSQYILLLNTGIVNVAMNALYKPFAEKDYKRINSVTNAVRQCNVRMGNLSLGLILLLSIVLAWLLQKDGLSIPVVFLMTFVMGLQQVVDRYLVCTYQVLVQADQKTYMVYVVNTITYTIRSSIQIFLILNRVNLVIVQAIPTIMILLAWMIFRIYAQRKYGFLDKTVEADHAVIKRRKYALSHTLSCIVANNSSALILSVICNQVAVSIYAVYNLVISHLHSFIVMVLSRSSLTSVGKTIMTEDRQVIRTRYSAIELVFCMVVSVAYSVCINMLVPFVSLYTAGQHQVDYVNYPLMFLMVAFGILNGIREPAILVMEAAAYYRETQMGAAIEICINLVGSIVGAMLFGVSGVLLGVVLSFGFRYVHVTLAVNRVLLQRACFPAFRRGFQTALIVGFQYLLLHRYAYSYADNWLHWVIAAAIVTVLCLLATFLAFYMTDHVEINNYLKVILKSKKRCKASRPIK